MKKAFVVSFLSLFLIFSSTPIASAVTIAELQAQINALMAQLTALQDQPSDINSESSGTSLNEGGTQTQSNTSVATSGQNGLVEVYIVHNYNKTWQVLYSTNAKTWLVKKTDDKSGATDWTHLDISDVGTLGNNQNCGLVDKESNKEGCIGSSIYRANMALINSTPLPTTSDNRAVTTWIASGRIAAYQMVYIPQLQNWASQKIQADNTTWTHPNISAAGLQDECRLIQKDNQSQTLLSKTHITPKKAVILIGLVSYFIVGPILQPWINAANDAIAMYGITVVNVPQLPGWFKLAQNFDYKFGSDKVDEVSVNNCAYVSILNAYSSLSTPFDPNLPSVSEFKPGDSITATQNLNVRNAPGTSSGIINTIQAGVAGTLIMGPVVTDLSSQNSARWWMVRWPNVPNGGWSLEGYLVKIGSSDNSQNTSIPQTPTTNTTLTPLTPAGGETYKQGTSFNIRWIGGSQNQDVYLLDNRANGTNQATYLGTAVKTENDVQSFYWTIPNNLATGFGYQIQFGFKEPAGFSGAFGVAANEATTVANLIPSDSAISFGVIQGGSNPPVYNLHLTNGSSASVNFIISVPNQPSWLDCGYNTQTMSLNSGGVMGVCVAVDASRVSSPGTYTTNLVVSGNFTNSPITIPITLTVTSATPTPPTSPSTPISVSAPTVSLNYNGSSNPITVSSGGSVNFNWSATNINKCQMFKNGTLYNDGLYNTFGGNTPSYSASFYVGNITTSATYTLTCTGNGGSKSASMMVNVGSNSSTSFAPSDLSCIPDGGIDDTLGKTSCCSGRAVAGSTVCSVPSDYGTTWESCTQICAPATVSSNVPTPNTANVYESLRSLLQQLSKQIGN